MLTYPDVLNNYATMVQYNMIKAEDKIEQAFSSLINKSNEESIRNKLPSLRSFSIKERKPVVSGYSFVNEDLKRNSFRLKNAPKRLEGRKRGSSTFDNSMVTLMSNRPAKMYSFVEKHLKNEIQTDEPLMKMEIPMEKSHGDPPSYSSKYRTNLINLSNATSQSNLLPQQQKIIEEIATSQLNSE